MVTKRHLLMRKLFSPHFLSYGSRVLIKSYNKKGTIMEIVQVSNGETEKLLYKISIDTNDKATWNGEFYAEDLILI